MKRLWLMLCSLAICIWLVPSLCAQSALALSHRDRLKAQFDNGNRWEKLSDALLRDYVFPLTSLGEDEVDWLPVLQPLAERLTSAAETPLDAAMLLNRKLWKEIRVIYSTKRDKANQDPLHSMRIGLASCSGLSILLVDACRSLGIPARVVGCVWRLKPGNHSWVEVWSRGEWYPLGSFEDCPPDQLWFLPDAAAADATDERYAIYATCATGKSRFYGWDVPAITVTARYTQVARETKEIKIFFAAERRGQRVAVPFVVDGKQYVTPGPLQDLNDYAVIYLPEAAPFEVILEGRTYRYEGQPNAIIVEQLP